MSRWLRVRRMMRASWWGQLLAEHDTEPTEFAGGILKIGIGSWMLWPSDTFGSSPTFAAMAALLPEAVWGTLLCLAGIAHLTALRLGRPGPRRLLAMVGFLVWFTLAGSFLWSTPASIGFPLFALLAAGQGWGYIRLGASSA